MWDLRPLAIMENEINIKVSLLWTVLLSPKIYSRGPRTSGTLCACSACWRQGLQLALCSPCLPFFMTFPPVPNWYTLCFSNTLARSSCWCVIRVLNCPPTLLLQFKDEKSKQNQRIPPCFPGSVLYKDLSPHPRVIVIGQHGSYFLNSGRLCSSHLLSSWVLEKGRLCMSDLLQSFAHLAT